VPEPPTPAIEPADSTQESATENSVIEPLSTDSVPEEVPNGDSPPQDDTSRPPEPLDSAPADASISIATTSPPDDAEFREQLEELKAKQQEEIQDYVERIDSLQSKLQYLAKSAAETAKKAASSAPPGSAERKLAEKDEKISLLMEEGQKLSTNEHKLRLAMKKLRAQMGDGEKQALELKKSRDKALSDAEALRAQVNGSKGAEKQKEETKRATMALQREIDMLKKVNAKKDDACRRLEEEWKTKAEQTENNQREAMSKALAAERQKQKMLEDALSDLRAEKDTLKEKARQEEIEWREKLERAVERARKTEEELKLELQAMEGKLEAMRTAAEEASSGSGGEAQVKMFRQIETLQTQYASARENWQGIEASLLAKAAGLEKERDEAQHRESEMRKKARDAVSYSPVRLRLLHGRTMLTPLPNRLYDRDISRRSCRTSSHL
jgi:hypothetical protein